MTGAPFSSVAYVITVEVAYGTHIRVALISVNSQIVAPAYARTYTTVTILDAIADAATASNPIIDNKILAFFIIKIFEGYELGD